MTDQQGGFQKASRRSEAALPAVPGHCFMLSFDAETTPLYFVSARTRSTAGVGALPLATALIELARALVTQAHLLTCPAGSDGLYYCGTDLDRLFEEVGRMQTAGTGLEAELARPTEPLALGLPSSVLHELLTFAVISGLLTRDFSLVMGQFVHRFDKSEATRPAASLALRLDGASRVAVTLRCATLRGANPPAAAALLMPGATRYALPGSLAVQLRAVTDALDPEESLSGPPGGLPAAHAAVARREPPPRAGRARAAARGPPPRRPERPLRL